jgi:isoleucyl-tRNA synthetase
MSKWLTTATGPIHFPTSEQQVLEFWREIDAFKTSQKLSEGKPEFSFYDGPPFATGKPHYGHLLAGTIKVSFLLMSQGQS